MGEKKKIVTIVGGGAAGFFCAVNLKEMSPDTQVILLEQGKEFLGKVKVSGGGRCNVTNALEDPRELVKNYPRGSKELLGPLYKFGTIETRDWFESRGVSLKTESDGRVFPVSNDSSEIVNCLLKEAKRRGVILNTHHKLQSVQKLANGFKLQVNGSEMFTDKLVLTTGSSKWMFQILTGLGIEMVSELPSLFTFNCKDTRLRNLAGISVPETSVRVRGTKLIQNGPVLITHQGFSGPAILKTSAYGARLLAESSYKFDLEIDWLPAHSEDELMKELRESGKKWVLGKNRFLPNRLWEQLIDPNLGHKEISFAELNKVQLSQIVDALKHAVFQVSGKSTFKEEFVTAGGVSLKEVDFRSFGIKSIPGLYAAGEILDIDGVTGGFNFQNAWTGAYLIASHLSTEL